MPANVNKRDLHQIHYQAWKKGVKSLYYCRSLSIQRADNVSEKAIRPDEFTGIPAANDMAPLPMVAANSTNYEECLRLPVGRRKRRSFEKKNQKTLYPVDLYGYSGGARSASLARQSPLVV